MSKDTTIKARRTAVKTAFLVMRKLKLAPVRMDLGCSVSTAYNYEKSIQAVLAVHAENGPQTPLSDLCNVGFKFNEVTFFVIRVTITECHLEVVVNRPNNITVLTGVLDDCYKPGLKRFIDALPLVKPLYAVKDKRTSDVC